MLVNMFNLSFFSPPFLYDEQVYYVYGFMLLVFVILIIVAVFVMIVGTYFLLNAENHNCNGFLSFQLP